MKLDLLNIRPDKDYDLCIAMRWKFNLNYQGEYSTVEILDGKGKPRANILVNEYEYKEGSSAEDIIHNCDHPWKTPLFSTDIALLISEVLYCGLSYELQSEQYLDTLGVSLRTIHMARVYYTQDLYGVHGNGHASTIVESLYEATLEYFKGVYNVLVE